MTGKFIYRPKEADHKCDTPQPMHSKIGTIWECDCKRRWVMDKSGWTYKRWRPTIWTQIKFRKSLGTEWPPAWRERDW